MAIDVRSITEQELPGFIDAMSTGFLDRPDVDKVAVEVASLWDLSRAWAAFDGSRIVGTLRTWATELTVPGGAQIAASAVTNVTVLPTHRRRGILRAMAGAEHAAARERGELAALLYAAEYPIYGRFGYGPACTMATWTLDTRGVEFRAPASGTMELAKPGADAREAIRAVYEAHRPMRAGEIRRREFRWDGDLGLRDQAWGQRWKGFLALHRGSDGTVDGYVRYRAEEKWEQNLPRGILTVDDLHALDDDAYAALWRYLADVDLVAKVKAEFRPMHERLPWLLANARAAQISDVVDGMWVRLFDVPRALAARRYEREGSLVLDVANGNADGRSIRVELEAGPDGASARKTTKSADLTVGAGALGAAYLGGTRLRDAALAQEVDEHRAGALARADALFRTADEPWCSTLF
jgi:predicted acetyltransferase